VTGTAPTYSEVRVYIDEITAGTANVGDTGTFTVVIAEADLGADGDKVLYATAKEPALDESAHSVEYAFVLDQVAPGIDSVAASADAVDSAVSTATSGTAPVAITNVTGTGTIAAGTWTISCVADSGVVGNVVISDGTTSTPYTVSTLAVFNGVIPGVTITFAAFTVGDACTVVVTAAAADRYTLKFNEDVDYTGSTAGTYDILKNAAAVAAAGDPHTYKASNDTGYWSSETGTLNVGDTVTFTVSGATDLAGNPGGTSAVPLTDTCFAGIASATALAP